MLSEILQPTHLLLILVVALLVLGPNGCPTPAAGSARGSGSSRHRSEATKTMQSP